MANEHEHKYLVRRIPAAVLLNPVKIRQGYLSITELSTVRVRIKGDKAFITVKGQCKGITRAEYEYEIPVQDAEEMLANQVPASQLIEKFRYQVPHGKHTVEIDIFVGPNKGLILAEVEVSDPDEPILAFPEGWWVERTCSPNLSNAQLALHPVYRWGVPPDCRIGY